MPLPPSLPLDLIVYDFDGVMTNNCAWVFEDGREAVCVNRSDGWGVGMLQQMSIPQLILSSEINPVVAARGRKLALMVIQGVHDKEQALDNYCQEHNYRLTHTLYVGNDTNDLLAMQKVGIAVAPSDAHPSILAIAHYVTHSKGGAGVIRELADWLIGGGANHLSH